MVWRRHTENPEPRLETALIATFTEDEPETPFILGLYLWRNGIWRHEETGSLLKAKVFFWQPEGEICATIPPL